MCTGNRFCEEMVFVYQLGDFVVFFDVFIVNIIGDDERKEVIFGCLGEILFLFHKIGEKLGGEGYLLAAEHFRLGEFLEIIIEGAEQELAIGRNFFDHLFLIVYEGFF